MACFIFLIIFLHHKKKIAYHQSIKQIEVNFEKNLLTTQLEIQEQTFQHVSREIHDNINLSLTLAKLNLNTIDLDNKVVTEEKINSSVGLLTRSIAELSDVSKSLNADIIIRQGLLNAVEEELERIRKTGLFGIDYTLTGNPVYLEAQKELIVFRIIQEAFNNIIKHARATRAHLTLFYNAAHLYITIRDNGRGFDSGLTGGNGQAGLKNMETRIKILGGSLRLETAPGNGTALFFTIPFE